MLIFDKRKTDDLKLYINDLCNKYEYEWLKKGFSVQTISAVEKENLAILLTLKHQEKYPEASHEPFVECNDCAIIFELLAQAVNPDNYFKKKQIICDLISQVKSSLTSYYCDNNGIGKCLEMGWRDYIIDNNLFNSVEPLGAI